MSFRCSVLAAVKAARVIERWCNVYRNNGNIVLATI